MVTALKRKVTIQPGGLIEVRSDELPPGASAEVIVLVEQSNVIKQPASQLVSQSDDPSVNDENPAGQFQRLAAKWLAERPRGADIEDMVNTPAYQAVIGMGEPAIGPVLQQLRKSPDHWFYALHQITGANPVPPEAEGKLREMADAWLEWGREQGYIGEIEHETPECLCGNKYGTIHCIMRRKL